MKRRVALALFTFFVAMACFGILSSAVQGASIALVSVDSPTEQSIQQEYLKPDDSSAESENTYSSCVPAEAIWQEGMQTYVFVVAEQAGFSGTELVARRVGVTVLQRGEAFTALAEGIIATQQQVIVRSDRVLIDGARIRVINA